MGRPPKDESLRKTSRLTVPLTAAQRSLIDRAALAADADAAAWARGVLLRAAASGAAAGNDAHAGQKMVTP